MAFEMKCNTHWQQKITNLEKKKNVVQIIMEWKLKLFGHIFRMDDKRLVNNVVFGIVGG